MTRIGSIGERWASASALGVLFLMAGCGGGGADGDPTCDPAVMDCGTTMDPAQADDGNPGDDKGDDGTPGGDGTDDGQDGDGGSMQPMTPVSDDPNAVLPARCMGDDSMVAMVGDSYLALSGDVTMFLEEWSGQTYRTYYVSGTQLTGGASPIPEQARNAYSEGPVETLIMDGGGNDVLIGDFTCRTTGPAEGSGCVDTVHRALDAAADMMEEAADNGVKEVVYFFYPHIPSGEGNLNDVLDYAYPIARDACESAEGLDCTFIDTREPFEGKDYFIADGIHPNREGSEVIANLIWDVMNQNCADGLSL